MNICEKIISDAKFVVKNSDNVIINEDKIIEFCNRLDKVDLIGTNWLDDIPIDISFLNERELAHLFLLFNSLSFSYWRNPWWKVEHNGKIFERGSWSLVVSLVRAHLEGYDIFNAKYIMNMNLDDLKVILRGNVEIPLIEERLEILNELGSVLINKYGGDFRNVLNSSMGDAVNLLEIIIRDFPLFSDISPYNDKVIWFFKRAQALVLAMHSLSPLNRIDNITALSDYIIPVVLRSNGIINFGKKLISLIDGKVELDSNSSYEVEIRASIIYVIDRIRLEFSKRGKNLMSHEINDYLWLIGENLDYEFHRCRTICY